LKFHSGKYLYKERPTLPHITDKISVHTPKSSELSNFMTCETFVAFWDISVKMFSKLLLKTVQCGCKAISAPALGRDSTQWLSGPHSAADK